MNGFTINPGRWFFDGFAYKIKGDTYKPDWLAYWNAETNGSFDLTGMELVQQAYANNFRDENQSLKMQMGGQIAQELIVLRFAQLIQAAHKVGAAIEPALREFPVFATSHDNDCVFESLGD